MALMFEPTKRRLPGFATGYETPAMQRARLDKIEEAIEKADEERKRREAMETFREVEARLQPEAKPKAPSIAVPVPPRNEEDIDLDEEQQYRPGLKLTATGPPVGPKRWQWIETDDEVETGHEVGTQRRFEQLFDDYLDEYEDTFGQPASFGSVGYKAAQARARDAWQDEQKGIPEDVITDREGEGDKFVRGRAYRESGLFIRSDEMRAERPPELPDPDADSKYDIIRDELFEQVTGLVQEANPDIVLGRAKTIASENVSIALEELETELLEEAGGDLSDEELREQMYLTMRTQQLLTEVLDEWEFPRDEDIDPPAEAIDEALRRLEVEAGDLFSAPEHSSFFGALLGGATKLFNVKFIPTVDPSKGFKPTFASMDTAFAGGALISRPVAQRILTGIGTAALGGEETFEAVTGIESHGVSGAIQGQIAEDILTEVINPAGVAMAIPFVGWGTRGLRGTRLASQITANLLGTGLEPGLARGTLRGLTLVARNPALIKQVPKLIRETPLFQRGYQTILEVRAGERGPFPWLGEVRPRIGARAERVLSNVQSGRPVGVSDAALREIATGEGIEVAGRNREGLIQALADKQHLRILRADDPTVFRRVVREMVNDVETHPSNLPLRKAIENELVAGRSMEDILESGLRTRPINLKLGEHVTVYHGASSLDESTIMSRGLGTESPVFTDRALAEAQATTAARILGGEQRVFTLRMKKADLLAAKGRPSGYFTTTKLGRSVTVTRITDDALSPALKALVRAERAGEELTFNTIRGALWDEARTLKTAVQEGTATSEQVAHHLELRAWLSAGDEGFADTLKALASDELGLRISLGASPERIASKVMEAVDSPVSPWGVAKWWSDEQGSFRLGRELESDAETVLKVIRRVNRNEHPGVTLEQMQTIYHRQLQRAGGAEGLDKWIDLMSLSELVDYTRGSMLEAAFRHSGVSERGATNLLLPGGPKDIARAVRKLKTADLRLVAREVWGLSGGKVAAMKRPALVEVGVKTVRSARKAHLQVMERWAAEAKLEDFIASPFAPRTVGRSDKAKTYMMAAFDPKGSAADRASALASYKKIALARVRSMDENSILRKMVERDVDFIDWSWRAKYDPSFAMGTELRERADDLKILVKERRGTPEQRLARLPVERQTEINAEIDGILDAVEGLSETARKGFRHRILQQALDIETDAKVLDAGRMLDVLIRKGATAGGGATKADLNAVFRGLRKLTEEGRKPVKAELSAMSRVLGDDITKELLSARRLTDRVTGESVLSGLGVTRALMASMDLSAVLRQGAILGPRGLFRWAGQVKTSVKVFFSDKEYKALVEALHRGRGGIRMGDETIDLYDLGNKYGLYLATDAGKLGAREEAWMTEFAQNIPGMRRSERSYTGGLDKLRTDFFDDTIRTWARSGREFSGEDIKDLCLFINNATGRGDLSWEVFQKAAPFLNNMFFSPRLAISRVMIGGDVARAALNVRRGGHWNLASQRIASTLLADVAFYGGALALIQFGLKNAGVDVSLGFSEPWITDAKGNILRVNPNFGKISVGSTHIDMFAGFHPTVRAVTNVVLAGVAGDMGQVKNIGEQFGRSKLAPFAGGAVDILTGRDYVGRKVERTPEDIVGQVLAGQAIPLAWQSPFDAIQAENESTDPVWWKALNPWKLPEVSVETGAIAATAFVGEFMGTGTASYFDPWKARRERQDEVAADKGAADYESADAITQSEIDEDLRVADLTETIKENALDRDSEWAKNKEAEEEFLANLTEHGEVNGEKVLLWTQAELDQMLEDGEIDGATWWNNSRQTGSVVANRRDQFRTDHGMNNWEEEEPETPVDAALKEYWDIKLTDSKYKVGGDTDYEQYEIDREEAKQNVIEEAGDPDAARKYFDSFDHKTDTQKRGYEAREQRKLLKDTPKYGAGIGEAEVANILDDISAHLLASGSTWGKARYLQWLYYQGEEWQTDAIATAYWVALGASDMVINPERTQMVLANENLVLFYPGLFRGLTEEGQQQWLNEFGIPRSKSLQEYIEELVEAGELSLEPTGVGVDAWDSITQRAETD